MSDEQLRSLRPCVLHAVAGLRPACRSAILFAFRGGCSSMAEHRIVDPDVAGSSPVFHPSSKRRRQQRLRRFCGSGPCFTRPARAAAAARRRRGAGIDCGSSRPRGTAGGSERWGQELCRAYPAIAVDTCFYEWTNLERWSWKTVGPCVRACRHTAMIALQKSFGNCCCSATAWASSSITMPRFDWTAALRRPHRSAGPARTRC